MQYHSIAKVSRGSRGITAPLAPYEPEQVTTPNSHSFEQGTLRTISLIIKQAIPYQTRGGTCCPGVSTPKTQSLANSSMTTTNREGCNLAHRSKPCSNHSIESHHGHLTSWQMEDQHSQHTTQAKLNIIKMERLVWWLKTAGLSNTTNHKNPILKYEGLGNQLMHAAGVY
jgi:hypothetical protein